VRPVGLAAGSSRGRICAATGARPGSRAGFGPDGPGGFWPAEL